VTKSAAAFLEDLNITETSTNSNSNGVNLTDNLPVDHFATNYSDTDDSVNNRSGNHDSVTNHQSDTISSVTNRHHRAKVDNMASLRDPSGEIISADQFPPREDGFQRLWTPHRSAYVRGSENQPLSADPAQCPFCRVQTQTDPEGLIVRRFENCYVLMNLYPYNSGHVMVVSQRHVPFLVDLDDSEYSEFTRVVRSTIKTLTAVIKPDGFNLGINQGKVAGAGVAGHLHQHIIPRWLGDANFFPLIAQTRTVGQLLSETRQRLADNWVD
jgi:ATP adenylyltransferase